MHQSRSIEAEGGRGEDLRLGLGRLFELNVHFFVQMRPHNICGWPKESLNVSNFQKSSKIVMSLHSGQMIFLNLRRLVVMDQSRNHIESKARCAVKKV